MNGTFKLSDPGSSLAPDPAMSEYLRCYEFPQPPSVRYGFRRFESPQAHDRVNLFGQAWLPNHAVGTVLLMHGYAEHGGNFAQLVREFLDARLAVALLDMRGHGLSEGPRGHLDSPNAYAEDAEAFLAGVFPHLLPNRPLFLWGHSLGALVGLQLLLRKNLPARPHAAVFTSPLLGYPELVGRQKILAGLAPAVAAILPTLPIAHGIPPQNLSHDQNYLDRRQQDPLICRVSTPRWLLSVRKAMNEVQKQVREFQNLCPTLLLLAGDERVTNLNEARRFAFQAYAGMKHKVIEFPGYFHELEKETDIRPRIVAESLAWLKSHA
jgi:acylglycerol lipase